MENRCKFTVYQNLDNNEYYLNYNGNLVSKNDFEAGEEIATFTTEKEARDFAYDVYLYLGEPVDVITNYFLSGTLQITTVK